MKNKSNLLLASLLLVVGSAFIGTDIKSSENHVKTTESKKRESVKRISQRIQVVKEEIKKIQKKTNPHDQAIHKRIALVKSKLQIIESIMETNRIEGQLYSRMSVEYLRKKMTEINEVVLELELSV